LQGPFTAADWDAIHPGEVRYAESEPKSYTEAGGNATTASATDPLGPQAGFPCRTVPAADDPRAASYTLPLLTAGSPLMGSPPVIATLAADGFAQVAARLWDVAPNATQSLVSQGFYRPYTGDATVQVFQLPPNGWQFAPGHTPKLELLGQSAGFG